ncbi:hypothetical protein [Rhizomonospora bruguierae]|uniref:hypothetical protein n=1 Tax=Rhizomonospora bruguierae TaxID=1581705 RepID=UPI001BCD5D3B|nr:hypothetical protein [Micromonospora sp. NBRC 107566]
MPRRGYSTSIGKIAKFYQDRRVSEIRVLGDQLRQELRAASGNRPETHGTRQEPPAR